MDPRRPPPASVVLPSQVHQVYHPVVHPHQHQHHHSHPSQVSNSGGGGQTAAATTTTPTTGLDAYKTTTTTTTTGTEYTTNTNGNTTTTGGSVIADPSPSSSSSSSANAAAAAAAVLAAAFDHASSASTPQQQQGETGTAVALGNNNTGIDLLRGTTAATSSTGGGGNSLLGGGATTTTSNSHSTSSSSSSSRQPLSDTTGNAQHHHVGSHHHHHNSRHYHHGGHHNNHHHSGGHHHAAAAHHQQQHHHQPHQHHYPAGQHQLPSLNTTRSCLPSSAASLHSSLLTGPLAPPPPIIPTPPILPTQALGSNNNHHHSNHSHHHAIGSGGGGGGGSSAAAAGTSSSHHNPSSSSASASSSSSSSLRLRRHQVMIQRRNRNPIYDCPEFAQYRLKQKEKDKQVWPDVLEHAFLDALLMVLHMGRRKFWMHNKQHGRNMIISEYIWLAWVATLQPGSNPQKCLLDEKLPDDTKGKFHEMYRKRKQVSSHIQVLKGFFRFIWAYHFFFSKGKEEGSKDKNKQPAPNRWYKENTDQRCFKGDPVLSALEARRLPSVRPNYEYFRQLLAMDAKVQVRPSTCWMYVANASLRDQTETATWFNGAGGGAGGKDGGGGGGGSSSSGDGALLAGGGGGGGRGDHGNGNSTNNVVYTYHASKGRLFREEFPHRYAFNNCPPLEESPWTAREREVRTIRRTLLHEYTWPLKQTESSSVREVCDEWETEHPDLHDILQQVIDQHDLNNAHIHPVSQLCDIIHVDVTFDIHRVHNLPDDSSFEWMFKINVAQPGLAGHDWRVRTWLERPAELSRNQGKGSTDSKGRSKGHVVSFRDDKRMMNEFTHVRGCHDDNPHCDCRNRQSGNVWLVPIPAKVWAESLDMCAQFPRYLVPKRRGGTTNRTKKEDEMPESDTVTQMDLMRGTAMFQELWSSPPVTPGSLEQSMWTRRAVILWTFNTIHFFDKDSNLCETPAGTAWRFLSAVDPLMPIHQERTLLQDNSPKETTPTVSPSPLYQPLLNSHLTDSLSSVWANSNNMHLNLPSAGVQSAPSSMPVSPMSSYPGASSLHVPGNFANGLVTPPPTAALPSNYVFEGPPSLVHSQDLGSQQHMGYLPSSSMDTKSSFVSGDSFDANSYLHGATNNTFYEEADDDEGSDTTVQGEQATDLANFGAHQWPNLNSDAHAANNAVALDWGNHGLHSLSMIAEEMSNGGGDNKATTSFDEDVQHLQHAYDPYGQLRTEMRDRRVQPSEGFLRHDLNRLRDSSYDRRGGRPNSTDDGGDVWGAAAASANCDESSNAHNYGQDTSAHLSQSTGSWNDEMSQLHHHETRGLHDFGPASLSPLLNRKRGREEDPEQHEGSHRYSLGPMPSYVQRDSSRYAPAAMMDRQEGHSWS